MLKPVRLSWTADVISSAQARQFTEALGMGDEPSSIARQTTPTAIKKPTKVSANYRYSSSPTVNCGHCQNLIGVATCRQIPGSVRVCDVCDLFEPSQRPAVTPADADDAELQDHDTRRRGGRRGGAMTEKELRDFIDAGLEILESRHRRSRDPRVQALIEEVVRDMQTLRRRYCGDPQASATAARAIEPFQRAMGEAPRRPASPQARAAIRAFENAYKGRPLAEDAYVRRQVAQTEHWARNGGDAGLPEPRASRAIEEFMRHYRR